MVSIKIENLRYIHTVHTVFIILKGGKTISQLIMGYPETHKI